MSTKYVEIPYNVKPEWKMKKAGYVFCNCHIDKTDIKDSICFTWNSEYGHRDQIATHIHYTKKEYKAICERDKQRKHDGDIVSIVMICIIGILVLVIIFGIWASVSDDSKKKK